MRASPVPRAPAMFPRRVGGEDAADAPPEPRLPVGHHDAREREGHAEEDGRRQDHEKRDEQLQPLVERKGGGALREQVREAHEQVREPLVERDGEDEEEPGAGLAQAERAERGVLSRRAPRDDEGADRDAGDERGQDRRERVRRGAQHEREQPDPDQLVQHRRRSRDEERGEGDRGEERRIRAGRSPGRRPFARQGRRPAPRDEPDAQHGAADRQVDRRRGQEREAEAEAVDKVVAAGERPQHGAETVEVVEARHRSPARGEGGGEGGAQDRDGPAHQDGRREHDRRADGAEQGGELPRLRGPCPDRREVEGPREGDEAGRPDAEEGDADLREGVEEEFLAHPVGQPPEGEGAQREPPHERRQHDGVGVGRVAEQDGEVPGPEHLVDEPGGPREEDADPQKRGDRASVHPVRPAPVIGRRGTGSRRPPRVPPPPRSRSGGCTWRSARCGRRSRS